jgi:hypothetical protein
MANTQMPPAQAARQAGREAEQHAEEAAYEARVAATSPWAARLARFGCAAKGVVYLLMGFLATRAAIGAGGEVADTKDALITIYDQPLGKTRLFVIGVGLGGYAFWCLARVVLNAENEQRDAKGTAIRVGYGAVGLGYVGLALAALQLAFGWGSGGKTSDATTRDRTARFLSLPFGVELVVLGGVVMLAVAAAVLYGAAKGDFQRHMRRGELGAVEPAVLWLGRIGLASLAVVIGIVGVFLIVAAL